MPFQKSLGVVITSTVITRPADTTAYAVGDLVANSTTAGSVTPFEFAGAVDADTGSMGRVDRIRIIKSTTSTTNASFRVHLYSATVTPANGDNGAWSTSVASYIGALDVTVDRAFTDGAEGAGVPLVGGGVVFTIPNGTKLYALLEARGAYTPGNAETFTLKAEIYPF